MPKVSYRPMKFSAESKKLLADANRIIIEYQAQGFVLTLRQLYYQFVSRDLIPNDLRSYKRLGDLINNGRLAGEIDWSAIEDRTRNLRSVSTWDSPADIIAGAAHSFRMDLWDGQPYRPEVWIEKEALAGVFEGVCSELRVPFFSCRGYTSQSEMWAAGERLKGIMEGGQKPYILHFGDHDPSGIDMTRDITDRLKLFMGGVRLQRMALNMDQVEQYGPPPNPAKTTDSRYQGYIVEFGEESWELDALEPSVLADLVRNQIAELRIEDDWQRALAVESAERKLLLQVSNRWDRVIAQLGR